MTARNLALILVFAVSGCGYVHTPKQAVSRPPIAVANTPEAQACARQVIQTHATCRLDCRLPYTQYNVYEVEQKTQQCVTACDDSRDAALKTCPQ